ncbi:MAG: hypothetical protein Q8L23_15030 [Caulobacter sp.]|nr:hypothetical protein [Caulobacter sp.]
MTKRNSPPARRADFEWIDGRIGIRKTGIQLEVNGPLVAEVGQWLLYFALLAVVALAARLRRRGRAPAIWFTPDRPRPWYLVRGAALWAGIRTVDQSDQADAACYFDDTTVGAPPPPPTGPAFNFTCADVSKSHVAGVFEQVFGYPLAVDPRRHVGPLVQKPEKNGVHGGRIVQGPLEPLAGHAYQRLIDTTDDQNRCRDLRTVCVAGAPVLVWMKIKPPATRFSINNLKAVLLAPGAVYSADELALIGAFTARMGLDWGGLDVLRDRDGRVYVVDVNKTDLGPVVALSWPDKVRSMARLGRALERMIADAARRPGLAPPLAAEVRDAA